jgi:hypothetical protein
MIKRFITVSLIAAATACTPAERTENSAICGITLLASTAVIIDQFTQLQTALTEVPRGLEGRIPTRAVGYGTTPATAVIGDDGTVAVEYTGQGFPEFPGFGTAMVDDSSEVFHGILIWDMDPPPDYFPRIGTIADSNQVIPLVGMLINWASVNSERCPLFAALDSTPR